MKALLLTNNSGEREGLYVQNDSRIYKLVTQGRRIDRRELLEMATEHQFSAKKIEYSECTKKQSEEVDKIGGFPDRLGDL